MKDLQELQSYPLETKVFLTKQRVREWVRHFGEDGVYISFSGGKDSTVLLHLVREDYPNIPAVFVDTGLEYPEIREFVKTFDNVTWLKPKKNFRQVISDYGYPFISKEVSGLVYYAQRYLTWWKAQKMPLTDRQTDRPTDFALYDMLGLRANERGAAYRYKTENITENVLEELVKTKGKGFYKVRELLGKNVDKDGNPSMFNYEKWLFCCNSPFLISNKCCDVMKKAPVHSYERKTGRVGITGQMASESRLRTQKWLQNGCNAFDLKKPISNPMSFWVEQDVLLYIYQHKLPFASVYGDIVKETEVEGQLDFEDLGIFDLGRPILKTTGCNRTGCVFCGFGCHLEPQGEGRFERLKVTHPHLYEYIMKPWEEGGLNYKEVIDWLNENGDLHIRY